MKEKKRKNYKNDTNGVLRVICLGSQFFIGHNRAHTQHLDGVHTCFGKVVEGEDVIDDIRPGDLIFSITISEE